MKLYHYWRSSCSWRVRWALIHKEIQYESVAISLLDNQQKSAVHLARNPRGTVPVLEVLCDGSTVSICDSIAILEWLEEAHPTPRLLPIESLDRARVRELVELINAGIQPLQNLSVIKKVSEDEDVSKAWAQLWIREGLMTFEKRVSQTAGLYCLGDEVTLADLCLAPQIYNAKRFGLNLEGLPIINHICENLAQTKAYKLSHPDTFQP